ncbi:MAG: hypothetical protein RL160_1716 [Bacteroidota bacterium]|jgi:signal transduction histidine kinase
MTLKRNVTIGVAIAFSIIYFIAAASIYLFFSSFREEEFLSRMEQKAENTLMLLVKLEAKNTQVVQLFDQEMINKLFNEQTIVFDSGFKVIYASIVSSSLRNDTNSLNLLRSQSEFHYSKDKQDYLGKKYTLNGRNYYVLMTAEDKYGRSKLDFLLILLVSSFIISIFLIWVLSFYLIKRLLKPLDTFERQITAITVGNLNEPIHVGSAKNEITLLTAAFNKLLERLKDAFELQKDFAASASHELRTPLTRIAFQLENMVERSDLDANLSLQLRKLRDDVYQLSELVSSLLLLANIEAKGVTGFYTQERLDEIIFRAYERVKLLHPEFSMVFSAEVSKQVNKELQVAAVPDMLDIAFLNLLKNACIYSTNHEALLRIIQDRDDQITVVISNNGPTLNNAEADRLFNAFSRGANARLVLGSGLGLRIVRHILNLHGARIDYSVNSKGENEFNILFQSTPLL